MKEISKETFESVENRKLIIPLSTLRSIQLPTPNRVLLFRYHTFPPTKYWVAEMSIDSRWYSKMRFMEYEISTSRIKSSRCIYLLSLEVSEYKDMWYCKWVR